MISFLKFTLISFLQPCLGFILLPIYLNYIPVEEYGVLTLLIAFFAIFNSFSFLKTDMAMRTLYFECSEEKEKKNLFLQLFSFNISLGLLWIVFFLIAGNFIFEISFVNTINFYPYGILFLIQTLLSGVNNLYIIYIQNQKNADLYSKIISTTVLGQAFLQFILIVGFSEGILGYLYGTIAVQLLLFLYILSHQKRCKLFNFKNDSLIKSLKFSIAFVPFLILLIIEGNIDKFILEKYKSLTTVAEFGVLLSLSAILVLSLNILDNAIRPFLYSFLVKPNKNNTLEITTLTQFYLDFAAIISCVLFFIGVNISEILQPQQYQNIYSFLPLLSISLVPYILNRYFSMVLVQQKKIKLLNQIYFVKVLFIIVLLYTLIPSYGINGILYTALISNSINLIIYYKIVNGITKTILNLNTLRTLGFVSLFLSFTLLIKKHEYLQIYSIVLLFFVVIVVLKNHLNELKKYLRR